MQACFSVPRSRHLNSFSLMSKVQHHQRVLPFNGWLVPRVMDNIVGLGGPPTLAPFPPPENSDQKTSVYRKCTFGCPSADLHTALRMHGYGNMTCLVGRSVRLWLVDGRLCYTPSEPGRRLEAPHHRAPATLGSVTLSWDATRTLSGTRHKRAFTATLQ